MDDSLKVLEEARDYYWKNHEAFCLDILGVKLDPWQDEAFRELKNKHYVAVRAGSGVGKTLWLSCLVPWFLVCKPYSRVPCTAPSQHQLFDLLWSNCYKTIQSSKFLKQFLTWTQTRIGVKGYEASWYAVARTASVSADGTVAEGLQGFHEENLLYIADECSGIEDGIFPAIEGALSQDGYFVATSNPTKLSGYFYDIFHSPRTGDKFHKIHVSCENSPWVSHNYIEMMRDRYGESHPVFQIKVLGNFAEDSDERLIPFEYIETMRNNTHRDELSLKRNVEIGVDIGRSKDKSIAYIRQGFNVLKREEFKRSRSSIHDTEDTVNWCVKLIQTWEPTYFRLDANGLGVGVYDALVKKYPEIVVGFIGQGKASDNLRYANLRAEGYWLLREVIPKLYFSYWPDKLIKQLSDIRKQPSPKGKLLIESKDDIIARAKMSPDDMDAFMYAFANCSDPEIINRACTHMTKALIAANDSLNNRNVRGFDQLQKGWKTKNFRFNKRR